MEYTEEDFLRRKFGFNREEGEANDPFPSWMRNQISSEKVDDEAEEEEKEEETQEEEAQVRP